MMNGVVAFAAGTQEKRQEAALVDQYAPLVKRIAYYLRTRLPRSVLLEDLIQAGMIGLLEAARNYNASQGASFGTYAGIRIRGAILDEIRRNDWAPRSTHRKARQVAETKQAIEQREGREAREEEMAEVLGLSLKDYHRLAQKAEGYQVARLNEVHDSKGGEPLMSPLQGPLEGLEDQHFRRTLVEAVEALPERERLIMSLYYGEELNLRDIGHVLGVSESRVSQLHSQAVRRLRARLGEWLN